MKQSLKKRPAIAMSSFSRERTVMGRWKWLKIEERRCIASSYGLPQISCMVRNPSLKFRSLLIDWCNSLYFGLDYWWFGFMEKNFDVIWITKSSHEIANGRVGWIVVVQYGVQVLLRFLETIVDLFHDFEFGWSGFILFIFVYGSDDFSVLIMNRSFI